MVNISKIKDSAFYVLFLPIEAGYSSNQSLHTFVKKRYNNWKKGLEKFEKLGNVNYHKEANLTFNFVELILKHRCP
jgi:hypothetical protein